MYVRQVAFGWKLLSFVALGAAFALPTATAAADVFRRSRDIPSCAAALQPTDLCRADLAFTADEGARRLGRDPLAYWIDGQRFNIVARSTANEVRLSGTLQEGLAPLGAPSDLWGATYVIPNLDRSVIEVRLRSATPNAPRLVFRGQAAPRPPPSSKRLRGQWEIVAIPSSLYGASRNASVYLPPGPAPRDGYPLVIMTDGKEARPYIDLIDTMIADRRMAPVAVIALWAGLDPRDTSPAGLRGREYVQGLDNAAYERHQSFVLNEALPYLSRRFPLASQPSRRLLFGYSNGADWVLAFGMRHPQIARSIAAFSTPGLSDLEFPPAGDVKLFLEAGVYEPPFLRGARSVCEQAKTAGTDCSLSTYYAGHGTETWLYEFARVIPTIFPVRTPASRAPIPPNA